MKKLLLISMIISISIIIISCRGRERKTEFFIWERSHTSAAITGLTDLGKKQEFLIIPSYIEGRRVRLGIAGSPINQPRGSIESENLQRVYFPREEVFINQTDEFFRNVPNLTHIFSMSINSIPTAHIVCWESRGNVFFYRPFDRIHILNYVVISTAEVTVRAANTEFIYNFDYAPNEGLFFIDNWQNELIRFRPNDPIREGFRFDGWFREPEGVTKWDFENDVVEIADTFEITRLYARWVEN